jgi:hypothetical protein
MNGSLVDLLQQGGWKDLRSSMSSISFTPNTLPNGSIIISVYSPIAALVPRCKTIFLSCLDLHI